MFHICYASIQKLFYFNFFSASFCTCLSASTATAISMHIFSSYYTTTTITTTTTTVIINLTTADYVLSLRLL